MNTTHNRIGYVYALCAAAGVTGYILINRYAYKYHDFNPSFYTAWFLIGAGIVALADSFIVFRSLGLRSVLFPSSARNKSMMGKLIYNGVMATLAFGLVSYGQRYTTAAHASIIIAANIVPTAFFSGVLLKRRVVKTQYFPLFAVLVGMYIAVIGFHSFHIRTGDIIIGCAALIAGYTNTYMRTLMSHTQPRVIADIRLVTGGLIGVVIFFIYSIYSGMSVDLIGYPIASGMAYWISVVCVVLAVKALHSNEAIVITQTHILIAPMIAVPLLGEHYAYSTFLGSLLMLLGVISFSYFGRHH